MKDEIFDGKSFQDLTQDIYNNSKAKKTQIQTLIKQFNKMITSIDDVVLIAPIIKEFLEVGVKNDEHLVKLAAVLQRILVRSQSNVEDDFALTEKEKQDLMESLQETAKELQTKNDDLYKGANN